MTRRVALSCMLIATLALFATAWAAQPERRLVSVSALPQGKPFAISSLENTFFAFVGELKGEYWVTNDSLLMNVTAGKIIPRDSLPTYNGRRVLGGIVLRFAREGNPPGNWAVEGTGSMPARFNISLAPGQTMPLPLMHFALAKPRDRSLSDLWLVFELWDISPLREGRTRSPTSAFIQSSRDILANDKD